MDPIDPSPPSAAPRAVCSRCARPERACLCRWVRPTANAVEVLILQHPMEVTQPKGSARLLHLSLARSRLEVGETFDDAQLRAWLDEGRRPAWLLYPPTDALPPPPPMAPEALSSASALSLPPRLVVLDGTWRKSLRMLALNPRLQGLPRLPLKTATASSYGHIRRAGPHQLSTLEAVCLALRQLEAGAAAAPATRYAPLLAAFEGFVAEQAGWLPAQRR